MIEIAHSPVEGKRAFYGDILRPFEKHGFVMCNWDYDRGFFDAALSRDGGVTVYLRLPVRVVQSKLDKPDALLLFRRPILVKHVVHTGLVEDDFDFGVPELTALSQFQEPLDPDDRIGSRERWIQKAEQALVPIREYVH